MQLPPKIEILPEHVIDQIKAGEVIERPGNLIKEILENSIDANSQHIELTIKNNGLDLINLKDDGHGIRSDDLPLAFSRHATSKISRFEDLYQLHSYGFRGEALASIASISRLQCVTFTADETEGSELRIEGGLITYSGKRGKNHPQHGTEINIQDLFYNTPARLKFVQSQQSEKNFIKKIIFSFILSHPEIEFSLKFDEEEKQLYPAQKTIKDRLTDFLPKAKESIKYSQRSYESNQLEIYLIPGNYKALVKFQYVFINDRFVLDKQILRVISNSLVSSFGHDDFYLLAFIKMPADHIDVNVHPNKTIIKLFETSKIIGLISASIKEMARPSPTTQGEPFSDSPQENGSGTDQFKDTSPTLSRDRHGYNMDGHFSPHRLHSQDEKNLIWVGKYFIIELKQELVALHGTRLLSHYTLHQLKSPGAQLIPLLVSEPFKITHTQWSLVQKLINMGLELEKLSSDTVVLRSIPDWMNGFPLKEVIYCLIAGESLEKVTIKPEDWPQSTWERMLSYFQLDELISKKIASPLEVVLDNEFK
jgi:DNA mismatch repair protein MutL